MTLVIICGGPVPAGLTDHSDDLLPQPICDACLARRDGRLMLLVMLIGGLRGISRAVNPEGQPERLAKQVRELLRFIQTCLPPKGRG